MCVFSSYVVLTHCNRVSLALESLVQEGAPLPPHNILYDNKSLLHTSTTLHFEPQWRGINQKSHIADKIGRKINMGLLNHQIYIFQNAVLPNFHSLCNGTTQHVDTTQ